MLIIQMMGLLVLRLDWKLLILVLILAGLGILAYFLENQPKRVGKFNLSTLYKIRLIFLAGYIVLGSVFFSSRVGLDFNPNLAEFFEQVGAYTLLVDGLKVNWPHVHAILFGALLVTNEANLLIRLLLQAFKLAPPADGQPTRQPDPTQKAIEKQPAVDEREYNAGRVIGILERLLIFFFVLNVQYAAVGFILAAKSFTRFRDLEKRFFAEYVLIGTLLSALLAMLGAGLVQLLINVVN